MKLHFKRPKKYEGVTYSICKNNKWNNYWEHKHQVPVLSEIPKENLSWYDLRFPQEIKYMPNDSGDYYTYINFQPINKGDVIYAYGYYIGIVSETRVVGNKENGYYIEIVYNRVFETVNNERILIDKERIDKLCMKGFLWFFLNLYIVDLQKVRYKTTIDIIPYYQNIINEQKNIINLQEDRIKEFEKILGSLDKRIENKVYASIQKHKPVIKDPFEDLPIMKSVLSQQEKSRRVQGEQQAKRWAEEDKRIWEREADKALNTLYRCMDKYERGY